MSKPIIIVRGITPTEREKAEWARFAKAAFENGHPATGRRFKIAASTPEGMRMRLERFDELQSDYRAWLVFNEYPA